MPSPRWRCFLRGAAYAAVLVAGLNVSPSLAGEPFTQEPVGEGDDTAASSESGYEQVRIGALRVSVWHPAELGTARFPLIVFSPGFTVCGKDTALLSARLAEAGYIVAAPDHKDSACAGGAFAAPEAPFGKPQGWSDDTYRQRGRDIAAVIDGLKSDPRWAPHIDAAHVGLIGHSLGGHVVLALAGAFPSWQRNDVKAVLACAPLIGPLLAKGRLENIRVPVMYQAGGRDPGTTALIKRKGGAFDRTRAATLVEFKGASHFAWSGDNAALAADISAHSVAFFDATLKGKSFLRPPGHNVSLLKTK